MEDLRPPGRLPCAEGPIEGRGAERSLGSEHSIAKRSNLDPPPDQAERARGVRGEEGEFSDVPGALGERVRLRIHAARGEEGELDENSDATPHRNSDALAEAVGVLREGERACNDLSLPNHRGKTRLLNEPSDETDASAAGVDGSWTTAHS